MALIITEGQGITIITPNVKFSTPVQNVDEIVFGIDYTYVSGGLLRAKLSYKLAAPISKEFWVTESDSADELIQFERDMSKTGLFSPIIKVPKSAELLYIEFEDVDSDIVGSIDELIAVPNSRA